MPLACVRVLRICAFLAVPAALSAQSSRAPTVFSPVNQMGTVNVRAAVVMGDYSVKPLPLLKVVARRSDRPDSVAAQTDLDGRVSIPLQVGTYTLRARTAQAVGAKSFGWAVRVVVRSGRTEMVQLTNANASDSTSTSSTIVASAPDAPPPTAVASVPTVPASSANKPAPAPEKQVAVAKPASDPFAVGASENRSAASRDSAKQFVAAPPPRVVTPAPRQSAKPAMPRTNTSKLILGLSLNGSSIRSDDLTSSTESGAGASAQLGWGFTKNFALILDASAARIESLDGNFDLAHVDLSGRWHFVSASHGFVPFVEVGYSGRAAMQQDVLLADDMGNVYTGDLSIMGAGLSLGGGMEYFIAPKWALGGSFKWTTGEFTRVQFDNISVDGLELDATSARFNLGFTWYPMRSR